MRKYVWVELAIVLVCALATVGGVYLFYVNGMSPMFYPKPYKNRSLQVRLSGVDHQVSWDKPALVEITSCGDFLLTTQQGKIRGKAVDSSPGWFCDTQFNYQFEVATIGSFVLKDKTFDVYLKLSPESQNDELTVTVQPLPGLAGQIIGESILKVVMLWILLMVCVLFIWASTV